MLDNNERLTMVTMKVILTAVRCIFILTIVRPFIIVEHAIEHSLEPH